MESKNILSSEDKIEEKLREKLDLFNKKFEVEVEKYDDLRKIQKFVVGISWYKNGQKYAIRRIIDEIWIEQEMRFILIEIFNSLIK